MKNKTIFQFLTLATTLLFYVVFVFSTINAFLTDQTRSFFISPYLVWFLHGFPMFIFGLLLAALCLFYTKMPKKGAVYACTGVSFLMVLPIFVFYNTKTYVTYITEGYFVLLGVNLALAAHAVLFNKGRQN